MIDGALQSMIDEVLICFRKISGSVVEPRRFRRHLTVIPGRERSERTRNPDASTAFASGFRVHGLKPAPRNDK
jgi:hypothetical protein